MTSMNAAGFDFEPLERLARFSWDWAPALCSPAHACCDYHRSWSLVRLLELDGAPPAGFEFFSRELGELARTGRRRVLVSGGADTGVTSLVIAAFRAHGVDPVIVFADRCLTPCWQNRLLAQELGLQAEIATTDLALIDCEPVDAVVAHSFLHLLPAEDRPQVLKGWARVVRPGGLALISTALSKDESDWVRTKDPDQVERRRQSLAQAAARSYGADVAEEMAQTAARFWMTSPGQPPALTRDNLGQALAAAGFELRSIEAEAVDAVRGPLALTTRESSPRERVGVVARRL